ncbi:MAG: hypothetical protein J5850_05200 [Clostridia bacterium]|nr:hypothetical protein [Clostridia bacterium]
MTLYAITSFIRNRKEYFSLWYSEESEGFFTDGRKVLLFGTEEEASDYAGKELKIKLNCNSKRYDLDNLEEALSDHRFIPGNDNAAEYWAFFADYAASEGRSFGGDGKSFILNDIYDKLFMQNVEAEGIFDEPDEPDESGFDLTDEEEDLTAAVLKSGIEIIDSSLGGRN